MGSVDMELHWPSGISKIVHQKGSDPPLQCGLVNCTESAHMGAGADASPRWNLKKDWISGGRGRILVLGFANPGLGDPETF